MANESWRARLITNLSNWLVQEGPLEQVGCECCTEICCTTENYQTCECRLTAYDKARAERQSESPPNSTTRLRTGALETARRNGTDR